MFYNLFCFVILQNVLVGNEEGYVVVNTSELNTSLQAAAEKEFPVRKLDLSFSLTVIKIYLWLFFILHIGWISCFNVLTRKWKIFNRI